MRIKRNAFSGRLIFYIIIGIKRLLPPKMRARYYNFFVLKYEGADLFDPLRRLFCVGASERFSETRTAPDTKSEKLVNVEKKAAIILIPKVATRSLLHAFKKDFSLQEEKELQDLINAYKDFSSFKTYTFIRNPWSRLVSCYNQKIMHPEGGTILNIINSYPSLEPNISFEDFVEFICSEEGADAIGDRHWISQNKLLRDGSGTLIDCTVGKFETLDEDVEKMCTEIGIPNRLKDTKPRNVSVTNKAHYTEYYNDRTRKMIAQRYEEDIDLFKYSFE